MKLININVKPNSNFYCPFTGKQIIYYDDIDGDISSVEAIFPEIDLSLSILNENKISKEWKIILEKFEKNDESPSIEELESFLENYDDDDLITFVYSTGGYGHFGYVSDNIYIVLRKTPASDDILSSK